MKSILTACLMLFAAVFAFAQGETIKVGSKSFTESVILGEIARQGFEAKGFDSTHFRQFGGTRFLWEALVAGEIHVYPEYTGTMTNEIFSQRRIANEEALEDVLLEYGVLMTPPLGFNNTYAIAMKEERAEELGIESLSGLAGHPDLSFGFSNEFMDRADGWPSLKRTYNLPQENVKGLDHDLALRGIDSGAIDVTTAYSTDAEIEHYNLRVLDDDQGHFPEYFAVFLYREELAERAPDAVEWLKSLGGTIEESQMIEYNARVSIDRESEGRVAASYLNETFDMNVDYDERTIWDRFVTNTAHHFYLVFVSMTGAIFIAVPVGIAAYQSRAFGQAILGAVGVIQTIPSLALFAFMIPLLGIGAQPAICALFLYSLLPIVRNTYAGLQDVPPAVRESAVAMGLPAFARLRLVELPLAFRSILAGIKTSAVINIGTATLGALIGTGGYGQPILTGIRLNNNALILEGAVSAAAMALLAQGLFELIELRVVPKGLRIRPQE